MFIDLLGIAYRLRVIQWYQRQISSKGIFRKDNLLIHVNAMKILWFNWRCWLNPAMGGAEVFTYEVAKRWVASGHDVTLFTSKFPGCKNEETVDGVKIVRAGGRFTVYRQAKRFYSKRFRKEGFDVIIDEINTRAFFCSKICKNKEKVIAFIHQLAREFWFYETPFPVSYMGYHFLENRWLKQYLNVPTVTVSQSTHEDLLALGFKNVSIVPEGLNFEPLNALSKKDSKPIIVFSGRLKRAKRPDHAIKAFAIVKEKIPNAELWVFGDGPFRKKLEQYRERDLLVLLDVVESRLSGAKEIFVPSQELLTLCREREELSGLETTKALAGFLKHFDLQPKPDGKIRGYALSQDWIASWRKRYRHSRGPAHHGDPIPPR